MEELIELCEDGEYDVILEKFKITRSNNNNNNNLDFYKCCTIFDYGVSTNNINLIVCMLFHNDNRYFNLFMGSLINKFQCDILERIFKANLNYLLDLLENKSNVFYIETHPICVKNNIQLVNIIIKYLPINSIISKLIHHSFELNNLDILDILFNAGFDIKSEFDKYLPTHRCNSMFTYYGINYETCIHLQNYNIDLHPYYNTLAGLFFDQDDEAGLKFCLDSGANPNDCLAESDYMYTYSMIKILVTYGVNLNLAKLSVIKLSIDNSNDDDSLQLMIYLIDHGLDISNYMEELLFTAVDNDCPKLLIYFIQLGANIHLDNELLLFYSAYRGYIVCVEILLENGADIHANNDTILLFNTKINISKKIFEHDNDRSRDDFIRNKFKIAMRLIKAGAISSNYSAVFCSLISPIEDISINTVFDKELFTYLLDMHINFNEKIDPYIDHMPHTEYIFELIVCSNYPELIELCLEYGADPFINNNGPLRSAIHHHNIQDHAIEAVKILLKLGCVIDTDFECETTSKIIDLLDQYCISHKLKKIDPINY